MFQTTREEGKMISLFRLLTILQVFLIASALWISGCGGSNIENPVKETDLDEDSLTSGGP